MTELTTAQTVAAFLTPTAVFALLLALHALIPGRHVDGYAHPSASEIPNRYRLNGLAVFVAALVIWWLELTFAPLGWLWVAKWHVIAGGVALSVVLTAWIVLRAPADDRSTLVQWMEGRARTVQFRGDIDGKMFLYIFGGALLGLNAGLERRLPLRATRGRAEPRPVPALGDVGVVRPGLLRLRARAALHVRHHRGAPRFQAHRGLHRRLSRACTRSRSGRPPACPPPTSTRPGNPLWLGGAAAVFLLGWVITRGANLQKYVFKRFPERSFLGFIPPATLTDGQRTILCSGFWGRARHMNYTGEILEALGMALAIGHFANVWTWAYFVYLTLFFVVRERIDEGRCAGKYGELWTQYRGKARYRLVPGVY